MCRMQALAATVLLLAASPAFADQTAPAPAAASRKASPEQRMEARRLDPLGRAAFWAREVEVDGRDTEAGVALSQALRTMQRYDDAANAAQRVLVVDPNNIEALLELARAHVGRGQGFYAIDPARKAQGLAPNDWRPVSLLAIGYEQASRDGEALGAHKQAMAMAPNEPAVLTNMAMFYAGHGDLAQAETLLRKAAGRPGATIQTRQNLALVLGLQGRIAEAEALARQDLPPETVANNLAYLKAAATPGAERSWDAMRGAQ